MSIASDRIDLAIVGGGVIGLAIAWRAAQRGMDVALFERDTLGCGASSAAAGMLAPVAEVEFGDAARRLLEMGLRSAAMWPEFARELRQRSGVEVPLNASGTLVLARDGDEARELERQIALRESLDLPVRRLRPSEARELEPAIAPALRLAMEVPDDHSVDPRAALRALRVCCEREGVAIAEHTSVQALADGRLTLAGADGETVHAGAVVVAAGAWSGQLDARLAVRPVKGQILRLRDPAGPGMAQRAIRYEGGYLVPRGDGRYVLGATVEEQGFNESPTVGGVYELLRHAREAVPGITELELEEIAVAFRPGTADNLPLIGAADDRPGLIYATGHYRNGILLAPLTAELALEAVAGRVTA